MKNFQRLFQSSPAPRRGRYRRRRRFTPATAGFNPRPRRGAGATRQEQAGQVPGAVSILARAEARALLVFIEHAAVVERVSILARAEARALPARPACCRSVPTVSILARAEARALQPPEDVYFEGLTRFNPRPRRGAGATKHPLFSGEPIMKFQSSPAPRRGRYVHGLDIEGNPQSVSILARAEARALPGITG